jgi:hypothetical protein
VGSPRIVNFSHNSYKVLDVGTNHSQDSPSRPVLLFSTVEISGSHLLVRLLTMALTLDLIIRFRLLSMTHVIFYDRTGINAPPAVAERPLHPLRMNSRIHSRYISA